MSIFEKYPKITLSILFFGLFFLGISLLEWSAHAFFGLGNVVLYDTHPLYGYRPRPHQHVSRNGTHVIHINNLGLRAQDDWNVDEPRRRIIFLGDSVTYGGSYVSNEQLFSHLVGNLFPGWQVGNAGVNGWGVSNVAAFVRETRFLSAEIYVSVFPEGDFYRGINRIGGQPFWTVPPRSSLEELLQYGIYQLHLKKMPPTPLSPASEMTLVATSAMRDLHALDQFLKQHGKQHYIYITPSRDQVLAHAPRDENIAALFVQYALHPVYLSERLPNTTNAEKSTWYHDAIHLSVEGHYMWATIIAHDLYSKQARISYS